MTAPHGPTTGGRPRRNRVAVAMALATMTASGVGIVAGPAQAKTSGVNGRIAFARDDGSGDTVTYTANPDGTDVTTLSPGASASPRWSPDGSQIAVTACADPPVCDTAAVVVDAR